MAISYDSGYDTLANSGSGTYQPWNPWQGMPGGFVAGTMMQMTGQNVMSSIGMTPMGFNNTANLWNNMRQQQFSQAHSQAVAQAAQQDVDRHIMPAVQRAIAAGGVTFATPSGQNANASASRFLGAIAPVLPPQLLDVATGGRSKANLVHYTHLGGRLRMDPATGAAGMSAASSYGLAEAIYQNYYAPAQGVPNDLRRSAGLSSLSMGQMFDELTRRGMMTGAGTERERVVAGMLHAQGYEEAQGPGGHSPHNTVLGYMKEAGMSDARIQELSKGGVANMQNLTEGEIAKLAKVKGLSNNMVAADAKRVVKKLDQFKSAVGAMQEIFGAEGQPNAPLPALWNALEAFTHGNTHMIAPERLSDTVRNLYNLAQSSGVSMENMARLGGASGQVAAGLGLESIFATQLTGNAMAMRDVYDRLGFGSHAAWGSFSADKATVAETQAQGRAAASPIANRMAAALRLNETVGGVDPGSRLGRMIAKIKDGSFSEDDMAGLMDMSEGDFVDMVAEGSGVSRSEAESAINNKKANEEYTYNNNLGGKVRAQGQRLEFTRAIADAATGSMVGRLRALGIEDRGGTLATAMASTMASSYLSMNGATASKSAARNEQAASDVLAKLNALAADGDVSAQETLNRLGANDQERNAALLSTINAGFDAAEVALPRAGFSDPSLINNRNALSDEATATREKVLSEAAINTRIQSRLAGLTGGGAMMRFMQGLATQANGDQNILATSLGKALGGQDNAQVAAELAGALIDMANVDAELRDMYAQAEGGGPVSAELQEKIEKREQALQEAAARVTSNMTPDATAKMLEAAQAAADATSAGGGGPLNFSGPGTFHFGTLTINAKDKTISFETPSGEATSAKEASRTGGGV